jgi:hypothetical protein
MNTVNNLIEQPSKIDMKLDPATTLFAREFEDENEDGVYLSFINRNTFEIKGVWLPKKEITLSYSHHVGHVISCKSWLMEAKDIQVKDGWETLNPAATS